MELDIVSKYAKLLVNYCTSVQSNDKVLIRSTYLAESLILACQKCILDNGAHCEIDVSIPTFSYQYYQQANRDQLKHIPILYQHAIESFDVIISISASFDVFALKSVSEQKLSMHQDALRPVKQKMMDRSANKKLRWVICNFPTESLAKAANMSLKKYSDFISEACFLNTKNPMLKWQQLSSFQARVVEKLNQGSKIHFKADHVDMTFKTKNRKWINSDGKRNMPSGEIFTSPIENSGQGWIEFTYPTLLFGQEIHGLKLNVKDGKVVSWSCNKGAKLLDRLFSIEGARYFGEIAIGTNANIKQSTLNTLFDEKIGGSIHMALGASYPETGGENKCSIHYDFITDFRKNSSITLDGDEIYCDGEFVIEN